MRFEEARAPRVSVVVATHERLDDLRRLLRSLEEQDMDEPFEVVVVDDASCDGTPAWLEQASGTTSLALTPVLSPSNGGPAVARNQGVRRATGEIVAFTDDDCRPDRSWLANLVSPIVEGEADVTTGDVRPDRSDPVTSLWVHTFAIDGSVQGFATCNAAYRTALFRELGGFDEAFRAGEDVDLGYRALATGARHRHVPGALVLHARTNLTYRQFLRTRTRWGDSLRAFKRHRALREQLYLGLFLRRHHATVCVETAFLVGAATVSPWAVLASAGVVLAFEARHPGPLPGLGNRLRYAILNWCRKVVDVAVTVRAGVRTRVLVL